ncbi:MAG: AAA family ATPase [Sandaracinaceae bacterium]|nr:AAA family ATPase [Sandaracinaceae bacterium]
MEFRIPVFERHHDGVVTWTSVGTTFREPITSRASSHAKVEKLFLDAARQLARRLPPAERALLQRPHSVFLQEMRVELSLRGELGRRNVSRVFPLVLETRRAHHDLAVHAYHHPFRPTERFVTPVRAGFVLADWMRGVLSRAWADVTNEDLESLAKQGNEKIRVVVFDEQACTIGQWWARAQREEHPSAEGRVALVELPKLGIDLTREIARDDSQLGIARPEIDRSAQSLALGASVDARIARRAHHPPPSARSFAVVGPSGSGRSMVIRRTTAALLRHDGFEVHNNLDLVSHVWELSARRLIAGMSRLGEWEKRLLRVLDEARAHRAALCFTDLALLGTTGRSRESDRALADLLEGPVSRGEVVLWGECTPEGWQRLADEAPRLAELLPRLTLTPAEAGETHAMLLHRARLVERQSGAFAAADGRRVHVEIDPLSIPAIALQTRSLFAGVANPGKSMTILDRLATRAIAQREARATQPAANDELPDASALVLEVLEERTGMPVSLLDGRALSEQALSARFEREVVGQPEATRAVLDLVVRLKTRLTDPRRPRAVYLFTGPTGTGKTETAKWIATNVFGDATRLHRFDMAELSGPDAASRLLGSGAPGEASLVARVREQPFAVVLLDEIEKAHRSALHLLLQLFDEGRLTDPTGSTADFTSTVIVMTSNLGARPRPRAGFATGTESESALTDIARAVRDFFPPELFHRIDRIVPFRPLDAAMARAIVTRELGLLFARRGLTERRIAVEVTDHVVDHALRSAFDPAGGARSVKRWLEREIAALLADEIARSGQAEQRRLTLHVREHSSTSPRLAVHAEALREAALSPVRSLELPSDLGMDELTSIAERVAAPLLDETADVAARLRAAQSAVASREPRAAFSLEAARGELELFREHHARLTADESDLARELYEEDFEREQTVQKGRTFSRRELRPQLHLSRGGRERGPELTPRALRAHIARALLFRRALADLEEPRAHVADVLVSRPGVRTGARMEALAIALCPSHATLVSFVTRVGSEVRERDPSELEAALRAPIDEIVLRLAGIGIRAELEAEHGTQLLAADDGPPELVSVHVLADLASRPTEVFERRDLARRAFLAAIERGDEGARNPDPLLPLVRSIVLARTGADRFEATIEDHRMGDATSGRVRDLAGALELARERWALRLTDDTVLDEEDA